MARYYVKIDEREYDIRVEYRSERYVLSVNGREIEVERKNLWGSRSLLLVEDESVEVDVCQNGHDTEKLVFMYGKEIPVQIEDYNLAQLRKRAGMATGGAAETKLLAPMPGLVVDLKVAVGDTVTRNQPLLVMEAMKMENVLKAKSDGTVKTITATAGQSVEKGETLIEFE